MISFSGQSHGISLLAASNPTLVAPQSLYPPSQDCEPCPPTDLVQFFVDCVPPVGDWYSDACYDTYDDLTEDCNKCVCDVLTVNAGGFFYCEPGLPPTTTTIDMDR